MKIDECKQILLNSLAEAVMQSTRFGHIRFAAVCVTDAENIIYSISTEDINGIPSALVTWLGARVSSPEQVLFAIQRYGKIRFFSVTFDSNERANNIKFELTMQHFLESYLSTTVLQIFVKDDCRFCEIIPDRC